MRWRRSNNGLVVWSTGSGDVCDDRGRGEDMYTALAHHPAGAAPARRSTVQRDCRWCWTGLSEWSRVALQRCRAPGGRDASGIVTAQRGATHLHCAHVDPEARQWGFALLALLSRGNPDM